MERIEGNMLYTVPHYYRSFSVPHLRVQTPAVPDGRL